MLTSNGGYFVFKWCVQPGESTTTIVKSRLRKYSLGVVLQLLPTPMPVPSVDLSLSTRLCSSIPMYPGIHIQFLSKSSAREVSLMIHLPGQNLGCPQEICWALVTPNCKIMRHFQGRFCGIQREQLCGRLWDVFKANIELDFPFLRINSNTSFL